MMLIPLLRIVNSMLSRVSIFAEETKVHNKKMTEHLQKLEEGYVEVDKTVGKKKIYSVHTYKLLEGEDGTLYGTPDEIASFKISIDKIMVKGNSRLTLTYE